MNISGINITHYLLRNSLVCSQRFIKCLLVSMLNNKNALLFMQRNTNWRKGTFIWLPNFFNKNNLHITHIKIGSVLFFVIKLFTGWYCQIEKNRNVSEKLELILKLLRKNSSHQGGNSQNFSCKFERFFVTLSCFYGVVIHRK